MNKLDGHLLFLGNACHVHEARRVGTGHILGTCSHVATNFVLAHSCGHGRLLDGEHAAEATALLLALGLVDGDSFNHLQQVDDLVERSYMLL